MQIKTTLRFHLTSVRIAAMKDTKKQQMLARMWGKKNPYTLLMGMYNHYGKQYGESSKN
jgi:hypothetical protein